MHKNESIDKLLEEGWELSKRKPKIEKFFIKMSHSFKDFGLWFQYRLNPKMKYHQIKPRTLKPNYYDQDVRLLHAVMELLCDYIEEVDTIADYFRDTASIAVGLLDEYEPCEDEVFQDKIDKELKDIYKWWKEEWPLKDKVDTEGNPRPVRPEGKLLMLRQQSDGLGSRVTMKFDGDEVAYDKFKDQNWKIDEDWQDLEQKYCERVVQLRKYLWI